MTEIEKCIELKNRGYTYDEITGIVRNKEGKEVGSKHIQGYREMSFRYNNKKFHLKTHRFAWYMFYEKLPENYLDHINGIKDDNRIINLRDVSHQKNHFNRKTATGYTKWGNKFMAQLSLNKKQVYLGLYKTKQEAHAAYLEAKKIYHKI